LIEVRRRESDERQDDEGQDDDDWDLAIILLTIVLSFCGAIAVQMLWVLTDRNVLMELR